MPIPLKAELGRKALHVVTALVPLALLRLERPLVLALAGGLAALTVGADVARARSPAFSRFIARFFGWMMRAEEHPDATGPVVLNGSTWVALAAFLLVLAFPLRLGVPVFVAFMLADAAAALVGRSVGRHRWPGTSRTLEGSLAFWVVAAGVLAGLSYVVAGVVRPATGLVAVTALAMAVAEAVPGPFNDNLRVPFVGALLLFFLGS